VAKITRRDFVKGVAAAGAFVYAGGFLSARHSFSQADQSRVFRVDHCPVDDWQPATNAPLRHQGLDTLLNLLADSGIYLYSTAGSPTWGGPDGLIAPDDVVLIKVNCQWKCRGTTNTDLVRGLIHRILEHPDGFTGEVVIIENGQGRGGFDGMAGGGNYSAWPEIASGVTVNSEQETVLTVDYLVNTVFHDPRVSSFLLDPIGSNFIPSDDHRNNGYRKISDVSYPCFTSVGGHRVELHEGIWNGAGYDEKLKVVNVPVLKDHGGTGTTGVLKHVYGIVSMADGSSVIRHYSQSGSQCAKVWSLVRSPDLNILDCIWVSFDSLTGYPPETTSRTNTLLAGLDPVALDYYAAKHIMLPLGGSRALEHDPDSPRELKSHLDGAQTFINENGGLAGQFTRQGDDNIEVITASAGGTDTGGKTGTGASTQGGGGGGGGCFIATAAYGCRMAEEVVALQSLRDICFSNNCFGKALVSAYYRCSPRLARLISKSQLLRSAVRTALYPLVWVAKAAAASRRAA
jgi:Domain of unknown function (DUF362)